MTEDKAGHTAFFVCQIVYLGNLLFLIPKLFQWFKNRAIISITGTITVATVMMMMMIYVNYII